MGAWGTGPFENDAALDFTGALADQPDDAVVPRLQNAMSEVLDTPNYIDGRDMDTAIAAACLIAARTDPTVPITGNGKHYLDQLTFTPTPALQAQAAQVFTRAFNPKDNEWHYLWTDAGLLPEAKAALTPYQTALPTP